MKTPAILAALAAALSCLPASAAPSSSRSFEFISTETPAFPPQLLQQGITSGETEAMLSVLPDGKIADWLVITYTDPAFEKQTNDILQEMVCKFPSSQKPSGPMRLKLRFFFEARGAIISLTVGDTPASLISRVTGPQRITKLGTSDDLDQALTVRHAVAPRNPGAANTEKKTRVTLEFLVDENGRVRMPVLHQGEDRLLAEAAADALLAWEFAPPTRRGQPVIVSARQEFVFNPQP